MDKYETNSLFSIIVPIYNAERFLEKCIRSIISQTYRDIEVLLINDGSTDNSLKICEGFESGDHRIKITSQNNMGASAAKNTGIDKARGDFLIFIDADDHIEVNMIEKLRDSMIKSGSELVICGYNRFEYSKDAETKTEVSYGAREYSGVISRSDFTALYKLPLLNQNWNKAYKTKIIKDNGLYFLNDFSLGEDLLFNLRYFKYCKKISVIEDILYNFICYNTNSLSRRYREDYFEIQQRLFHEVVGFINTYYMESETAELIRGVGDVYLRSVISYISIVSRSAGDSFSHKYKKIRKMVLDKEVHDIALKAKTDDLKINILIYLIKMKLVAPLVILLKLRA